MTEVCPHKWGSESWEVGEAGGGPWEDRASLCQPCQGDSGARTHISSPFKGLEVDQVHSLRKVGEFS